MMYRLGILFAAALIGSVAVAHCQSVPRNTGLTIQGPADQASGAIVKDALGRPCIDIEAVSRPETINPNMQDHIVSLKNNCPKLIKAKVCYFNSDRCRDVVLEPYKRVDSLLGTMRGIQFFRYTVITK
ncbi:hypothetical protein [Bradyrhizobium manausense]|uniref:Uncharacterized protein n=1 Tax=Bradyrhizobium manausense TaxID=989370 RepID=A0A0R3DWN0_9BRAD|nr:hypothetical protein [Bradyrhizobium manausense]KRQ12574.1 hypothetical protein AOQ71_15585 [Bradyrhizobium manausense]